MKISRLETVTRTYCDSCGEDLTRRNSGSTQYDKEGLYTIDYCDNECKKEAERGLIIKAIKFRDNEQPKTPREQE